MKLSATIVSIEVDRAVIRAADGREWSLAIKDVPDALRRENQAIYIEHGHDGYATAVMARTPDPLPEYLQKRIDALRHWANTL
jgi:hypothetical protein